MVTSVIQKAVRFGRKPEPYRLFAVTESDHFAMQKHSKYLRCAISSSLLGNRK